MTMRAPDPITVIDLFSGAGGLTQGFLRVAADGSVIAEDDSATASAFTPVAAVEVDAAAAMTYAENFGDISGDTAHIYLGDIANWAQEDLPKAEVILGGPPCQGFSGLGKENPNDPRNQLWRQYFKVVEKVNPKVFVIENVDRFITSQEFDHLRTEFKEAGYEICEKLLNSADFGVPQARRRTIIIGTRSDLPMVTHPRPTHQRVDQPPIPAPRPGGDTQLSFMEPLVHSHEVQNPWVTLAECLKDVTPRVTTTDLPHVTADGTPASVRISRKIEETGHLDRDFMERIRAMMPGPFRSSQLHIGRNPTALSLARYKAIPRGGNRHHLAHASQANGKLLSTESWMNHQSGSGDVMGRLVWEKPSVTIRTEFFKPEKGRYLHPDEHRPITHLEAALIQGFPQNFRWFGSKSQIARQIGNAVPVGLGTAIAKVIRHALRGEQG
ncbi:DNA cytosine methyltransferase [Streptomyces bugieae]|uniref:Cytosine-specific methyltransferase n=1 Tax=Streptomyces bugieae TaxID=3098223 RepID=A0ABU7P0Y7_9ACTN|nr:DNA cytosine methyltransferase [Streptomyces sp. DSM 41528]